MKRNLFLILILFIGINLRADEGMWLPSEIAKRIQDMQSKGCKLSAEDIYSINNASLKDAVVQFGGGCTGEVISKEGLIITNHHCGYGQIQAHSSLENDYLTNGFWAMTRKEELPNKGLTVSFLEYMEDVTDRIKNGEEIETIIDEAQAKGKGLVAHVKPLYYGNVYYLFVYKVFRDVRLVGAPPSSIGKFGGDTDNWMWPRHTGDFSLFRIYAGRDNEPADYSEENIPYTPKRSLKVNARGVKEGDFTMVYGFPGRTNEYLFSADVKNTALVSNPHKIKLRTLILDIQKREMEKDRGIRIKYASKNASVANAWKKWQGEAKGVIKMKAIENKEAFEESFHKWAQGNPEYENIVPKFRELYAEIKDLLLVSDYQKEALMGVEVISFAGKKNKDFELFNKNYYMPIDKECFIALYNEYNNNIADTYKSPYFKEQLAKYGSIEKWADALFNGTPNFEMAEEIYNNVTNFFRENIQSKITELQTEINNLYTSYMVGQMEYNRYMRGTKIFYPDANSTLRVAYGKIDGYSPADAVYYVPFTTLDGIIQKDNPEIYDYNIPDKLREIYKNKDFGEWEVNGTIPVAFLASNHTTGGNSGSPVLDAEGTLLGVNFDRVWEGTMSDIVYDPEICRNIAIDIRYALFIIDKLAGAKHLLEEMEIVR